ncbi:hypothetical protein EJ06DRAFT_585617 [Trichodelitschia bisporula]|uniref:Uncharacterized protein n=1 Tax=Trichodelitschia bisporula TaxID=703511 RepID=A0A6G1HJ30_9PEZI|nr:hypothetical protein EJ06DRAFT_585617 [Trichodelitschia bisporula]
MLSSSSSVTSKPWLKWSESGIKTHMRDLSHCDFSSSQMWTESCTQFTSQNCSRKERFIGREAELAGKGLDYKGLLVHFDAAFHFTNVEGDEESVAGCAPSCASGGTFSSDAACRTLVARSGRSWSWYLH